MQVCPFNSSIDLLGIAVVLPFFMLPGIVFKSRAPSSISKSIPNALKLYLEIATDYYFVIRILYVVFKRN